MQYLLKKKSWMTSLLIRKRHALGIAEFVQVRLTCKLNHRWWPTHKNERLTARRREVGFNHVCSDKARTVLPIWNKHIKLLIWLCTVWNLFKLHMFLSQSSWSYATITASRQGPISHFAQTLWFLLKRTVSTWITRIWLKRDYTDFQTRMPMNKWQL